MRLTFCDILSEREIVRERGCQREGLCERYCPRERDCASWRLSEIFWVLSQYSININIICWHSSSMIIFLLISDIFAVKKTTAFSTDRQTDWRTDQRTNGPTDQRNNGRTDQCTDGPTDGRTNGQTDQRTDRPSYRDEWTHLIKGEEDVHYAVSYDFFFSQIESAPGLKDEVWGEYCTWKISILWLA